MSEAVATRGWLEVPHGHQFGLEHLPYGAFSHGGDPTPRVGVRVGDLVLDLTGVTASLGHPHARILDGGNLDRLLESGPQVWADLRAQVTTWLSSGDHRAAVEPHLVPVADAVMQLPFTVADYVDFYASEHHATNIGRMFRPDGEPLTPNWRHLPIGYHGRAGTVVPSGTDVVRPHGQRRDQSGGIVFGPSARLDFEAEVGFVVGSPTGMARPVGLDAVGQHVFGAVLVNDWSARDIQAWEYVPLGPFLGKSFATSVSTWVTPLAALAEARVRPPTRTEPLLPYLDDSGAEPWGLDLQLEVRLNGELIAAPPFAGMYWTAAQQLAHMTSNGASLRAGDLFASGTVSGPQPHQRGSMIELSWGGAEPLTLADGSTRSFLLDGDEITISATAPGLHGTVLGMAPVTGRVLPHRDGDVR